MLIRESTEADIPAIVALLKKSLGETSTPKTIDYWVWKHIKNPFGESMVLVSDNNGQLIGVRAMMRWNWQRGQDAFNTLRAVDTVTHPDHQGKGIFSTLTRKIVNRAQEQGINFIFNTPNPMSLPGYLKLGWISEGKLKVGFSFFLPSIFGSVSTTLDALANFSCLDDLCKRWNALQVAANHLFTPKSPAYLKWRYIDNPVIKYFVYATPTIFLAMYIRKRKRITELRVAEFICLGQKGEDHKKAKSLVRQWAHEQKAGLITFAPQIRSWMPGLKIILPIGPILTTKKINVDLPSFKHVKMAYQLGDMELF
jgi:GNAT superfamily N-acetyltransferase